MLIWEEVITEREEILETFDQLDNDVCETIDQRAAEHFNEPDEYEYDDIAVEIMGADEYEELVKDYHDVEHKYHVLWKRKQHVKRDSIEAFQDKGTLNGLLIRMSYDVSGSTTHEQDVWFC